MEHAHVTRPGEIRRVLAGLAIVGLAACGGSGSTPTGDAGHKDAVARKDAPVLDASTGLDAGADAVVDTGTVLHREAAVLCEGAGNCAPGALCCDALGGIHGATCVTGTSCPTGEVELCGTSNTRCSHGSCQHYTCTIATPHHEIQVVACSITPTPNVSCTTPLEGGAPDGGSDGG